MKIEKVKSREYKNKEYFKYRLVIPKKVIKKAGFKAGTELKPEAKKGEIKLRKKNGNKKND